MTWNQLSWPDRNEVLRWACQAAGTTIAEVRGRDRHGGPVARRQFVCALLRSLPLGISYPEIGKLVARDHVTVIWAQRQVESRPELKRRVELVAAGCPR